MLRLSGFACALMAGVSLVVIAPAQAQSSAPAGAMPEDTAQTRNSNGVVKPNVEQLSQIEGQLRKHGYVNWHNIRRNDNGTAWLVSNAVASDGHVFDLTISAANYTLVERKLAPED